MTTSRRGHVATPRSRGRHGRATAVRPVRSAVAPFAAPVRRPSSAAPHRYRGRFFVEKTLGLKNAVGVAVIGSALILKAMSFMTLAIGLLVAKGLEDQATFEDDARGWKVSSPNGDFTASGPGR